MLTKYGSEDIGYDTIGNPIVIGTRDSTNSYWNCGVELDWDGRQLKSYQYFLADENERYYENTFTYQYNADGIRTSKTVNGIEHKYYLNGSQILAETWKQGNVEHLLIFVYDENGSPIALKYRTNAYAENTFDFFFYEKNLQGDIIGIFNTNGRRVGWYIYDAWGTCSTYVASSTSSLEQSIVRSYNPYRYRGYYYDTETQLYYLQSRYYNPAWGRFLNADGIIGSGGILGYNMFAYCNNNPVMLVDFYGTCACPYNGTATDFHRLENGLPPTNCTCPEFTVEVGVHEVLLENYHTCIIIKAKPGTSLYSALDTNETQGNDYFKYKVLTLGAGGDGFAQLFGNVEFNYNRDKDVNKQKKKTYLLNISDVNVVYQLLTAVNSYKNNASKPSYAIFPKVDDDKYNSNSFTSGLLNSVGVGLPRIDYNVPGWNKPIPASYYK